MKCEEKIVLDYLSTGQWKVVRLTGFSFGMDDETAILAATSAATSADRLAINEGSWSLAESKLGLEI